VSLTLVNFQNSKCLFMSASCGLVFNSVLCSRGVRNFRRHLVTSIPPASSAGKVRAAAGIGDGGAAGAAICSSSC
jgi:hypothetical protein